MPKYQVMVPEVHYVRVEIEASSPRVAIREVNSGDGEYLDNTTEYSHTLETAERMVINMDTGEETVDTPAGVDEE
jgi:hypothetical protein